MPKHVPYTATMAAIVLIAATGCGDDSSGPTNDTLPITWNFDGGLEGWTGGSATAAGQGGAVSTSNGTVTLQGWGAPGQPDAWISRSVALPDLAYSIRVLAISDCAAAEDENDTSMRILLVDGGDTAVLGEWQTVSEQGYDLRSADLYEFAGQTVTLRIEMDDEGEQEDDLANGELLCIDQIQIIAD